MGPTASAARRRAPTVTNNAIGEPQRMIAHLLRCRDILLPLSRMLVLRWGSRPRPKIIVSMSAAGLRLARHWRAEPIFPVSWLSMTMVQRYVCPVLCSAGS